MEFLISLAIEETSAETKVYFRIFNKQFVMKLKDFSIALGLLIFLNIHRIIHKRMEIPL